MTRKRRSLVLTNEGARHPFRSSLPAHVFAKTAGRGRISNLLPSLSRGDWRSFVGTYCASFVVVSTFIA